MNNDFFRAEADGAEIQEIMNEMRVLFQTRSIHSMLIACLTVAIIIEYPNITPEQIRDGVFETSQFMSLWVDKLEHGPIPPEKMN